MIVRTLTAADAEPVAALIRTAFAALSAPVDPPPSALRETAENVARLIENGGGAGADIDGTLAGAMKEIFTTADKYNVSIDANYSNRTNKIAILSSAITIDMVLKESK